MEQKTPSTLAAAAFVAMALAGLAVPAWAQTTIDTFTTNQAALADPPGGNSTATGGADIIGTRRGLVVDNLTGAGPTTVSVASGALNLTVTNTTPDSRGEATVTWDGDTSPTVLNPVGLGGVNLTTGGARTFRIRVAASAVANQEIELLVYGNATDFSRASLLLPVVGAPQNFYLPFSEFVIAGGVGADFSSVGAVQMVVRGKEGTVLIDEVVTAAPVIAATKADALITDVDGDTKADPGDRLRYTVTITNTGGEGISVDLTDSVDANTTLVAGSVSSTPVAKHDQYLWFGNVNLSVDGTPFPTLLANDTDPDGDTVTISAFDATTAQGGTVTGVNVNTGEFTYNPPVGFSGVDSFNYTIVDNDAHASVATARITLEGVVWFVDDSNTTPPHLGTLNDPFQTLASVNGTDPDEPGDIIFLFDDDGTPYPGGMTLEANQRFLGQGVGLVLGGQTIVPVGGTPQITNSAGVGLTLAADNTVRGLDVQGTSGAGIFGATFGTLTADTVSVINAGGSALDLATGTLAATFGTLSSAGTASPGQRGIQLVTVAGSMTVTTTTLTNPTTHGIRVATSPGVTLDFGNTTITDTVIGTAPAATGIDVATGNAGSVFTFDSLSVTTDGGGGLLANASGTINIGGTGNTIDATGGAAVDITSTSLGSGATFSTLSSTNSAGKGVNLDTVTGSFTGNGGSISGPAGVAFDINAGASNVTYTGSVSNTANARLIEVTGRTAGNVTFSGNLSGTSNSNGILVQNNNTGTAQIISFSAGTKTLSTGADTAVTLDNNDTAAVNFTGGGLDIDTTSGIGFSATGGAVGITVQGSNNTISSATGTALNVVSTDIGASGLTFQSISAGTGSSGPANGIVLSSTGALGSLTVTGTGSAGSGGAIQDTTSHGISLTSTLSPSFDRMNIDDTGGSGIKGTDVTNVTITNCAISDSATALGADESNIAFNASAAGTENNLDGVVTITGNTLTNAFFHGVDITNFNGTLTNVTISNNPITSTTSTATSKGSGIRFQALGSATTVAHVTTATISNNVISNFPSGSGLVMNCGNSSTTGPGGSCGTPGSGTNVISITGNRTVGQASPNQMGSNAFAVAVAGGNGASRSQANYSVTGNGTVALPLTNFKGTGVACSVFGSSTATCTITNNVMVANNILASRCIASGVDRLIAASDTPDITATISNNSITACDGNGIFTGALNSNGTARLKIQNNNVAAPLTGVRQGIRIDSGTPAAAGTNTTVCLNISGNTSAGSIAGAMGIGMRKEGTAPATNSFAVNGMAATSSPGVEAFIDGLNPAGGGTLLISATSGFTNCSLP